MKIAIIGGGAAGCFAAANIPFREGQEVTVFEKTGKILQKVKVSGGGRCNVTHECFDIPELIEKYPRGKQLLKKTLHQFSPRHTIEWFKKRGVEIKAEQDGRMFPVTDSSQTIIDCLWQEMMQQKVKVAYNKSVEKIEKTADGFIIYFGDGKEYQADKILIACGGFPKELAYDWLKKLGHTIQAPVPSLFTFNLSSGRPGTSKHAITELMGVSVPNATVKIPGTKFSETGPLLITHWGMSGPAVLRTSAWAARELAERNYDFRISINWLKDVTEADLKEQINYLRKDQGGQFIHNKNPFELPKRLWEYFMIQCKIKEDMRWGDLPATNQNKLIEALIRDIYEVKGKTTFKEEFVTSGGINLSEINPQTMESRVVPGIYFAGEILNVDGITGGFNFQHAWSSSWIAAQSMAQ